jgi:hypothetical protein
MEMAMTSFLIQWLRGEESSRLRHFTVSRRNAYLVVLAQFRTENRSTLFLELLQTLTDIAAELFLYAAMIFSIGINLLRRQRKSPGMPGLL